MKFTIKNRFNGGVIFAAEIEHSGDLSMNLGLAVKCALAIKANLSEADLRNANLRFADLRNANLSDANLINANLSEADLSNADLRFADLSNADLSEADLSNADLRFADLRNANLRFADLRFADLSDANLINANLSNADLSNADLRFADLSNADLRFADLSAQKENLLRVAEYIKTHGLKMDSVHADCKTVHCIAGTACAILPNGSLLEQQLGWSEAARVLIGNVAATHFHDSQADGMAFIDSVLANKAA